MKKPVSRPAKKDDPQNHAHPRENETAIVLDSAEDDVVGIAGATFEIAAAEIASTFICPITGSIGEGHNDLDLAASEPLSGFNDGAQRWPSEAFARQPPGGSTNWPPLARAGIRADNGRLHIDVPMARLLLFNHEATHKTALLNAHRRSPRRRRSVPAMPLPAWPLSRCEPCTAYR